MWYKPPERFELPTDSFEGCDSSAELRGQVPVPFRLTTPMTFGRGQCVACRFRPRAKWLA